MYPRGSQKRGPPLDGHFGVGAGHPQQLALRTPQTRLMHLPRFLAPPAPEFSLRGQRTSLDTMTVASVPDSACLHRPLRVNAGLQGGACWEPRWGLTRPAGALAPPITEAQRKHLTLRPGVRLLQQLPGQAGVCPQEGQDCSWATWQASVDR